MESGEVRDRFLNVGLDPTSSTPEEFRHFIQSETASLGKLIRSIGLKAN